MSVGTGYALSEEMMIENTIINAIRLVILFNDKVQVFKSEEDSEFVSYRADMGMSYLLLERAGLIWKPSGSVTNVWFFGKNIKEDEIRGEFYRCVTSEDVELVIKNICSVEKWKKINNLCDYYDRIGHKMDFGGNLNNKPWDWKLEEKVINYVGSLKIGVKVSAFHLTFEHYTRYNRKLLDNIIKYNIERGLFVVNDSLILPADDLCLYVTGPRPWFKKSERRIGRPMSELPRTDDRNTNVRRARRETLRLERLAAYEERMKRARERIAALQAKPGAAAVGDPDRIRYCTACGEAVKWGRLGPVQYQDCKSDASGWSDTKPDVAEEATNPAPTLPVLSTIQCRSCGSWHLGRRSQGMTWHQVMPSAPTMGSRI